MKPSLEETVPEAAEPGVVVVEDRQLSVSGLVVLVACARASLGRHASLILLLDGGRERHLVRDPAEEAPLWPAVARAGMSL